MKAGCSGFTSATLRLQPGQIRIAPALATSRKVMSFVVREREQRRLVHHHDVAQRRQPIGQRQDLVDVLLVLGDEHDRAAVAHLVFDLLGRGGRINAVDHGAERLGGQVADQPLLAGIRHDGDAIAGLQARAASPWPRAPPARRIRPTSARDRCRASWRETRLRRAGARPARPAAPARWCGAGRPASGVWYRARRMTLDRRPLGSPAGDGAVRTATPWPPWLRELGRRRGPRPSL